MEENKSLIVQSEIQMIPVERLKQNYNNLVSFTKAILKDGQDYGVIPGVPKPSLLKPGAEKLRLAYGLQTETELVKEVIDFDRPYLDFTYRTTVKDGQGRVMGQCEGNTNSYEPKWRYVWVAEHELPHGFDKANLKTKQVTVSEFKFAVSKKETTGAYGKPIEHWNKFEKAIEDGRAKEVQRETKKGMQPAWEISTTFYRIPNPDVIGLKNTLMKMAQKRSFVGAVILSTGASEFFTQDAEDMKEITIEDAEFVEVKPEQKAEAKPEATNPDTKKTSTKKQQNESSVADELKDLGVNLEGGEPTQPTVEESPDAFVFRAGEIIAGLITIKECEDYAQDIRKNKDITPNQKLKIVDLCNKRKKAINDEGKK